MGNAPSLPQPPLPIFTLHLHDLEDGIVHPGDKISGHILLIPIKPLNPFGLDVSFFGNSFVWHRMDTSTNNTTDYFHYRDHAPLFEVNRNLLPVERPGVRNLSGYTVPGQRYTFPFEFQVPPHTTNYRLQHYKYSGSQRWHVNPHTLPPSFLHTTRGGTSTDPNYAKVEYCIKARLWCPEVDAVKGEEKVELTAEVPIQFQPLNPHLREIRSSPRHMVRLPKTLTLQSSILSGNSPSTISFRQSIRDRFFSDTPNVTFELIVSIPDLLLHGSEFQLRTSFDVLSKTENVSHIPAITFRILKLRLIDYTFVRAPRDLDATSDLDGHHRINNAISMPDPNTPYTRKSSQREDITRRKTHLNALPESVTVELEEVPGYEDADRMEQAQNCEAWFTARVPGNTTPSFKSFAISRRYGVKVKVGVGLGGKGFEFGGETEVRGLGGEV